MLDALQTAAFDAIGGTVAATTRDQVIELIEQHVRYGGARNVTRMLQGGWLVDSSGRT